MPLGSRVSREPKVSELRGILTPARADSPLGARTRGCRRSGDGVRVPPPERRSGARAGKGLNKVEDGGWTRFVGTS